MPIGGSGEPNLNTTPIIGKIVGDERGLFCFFFANLTRFFYLETTWRHQPYFINTATRALSINGQNFMCVWARVGGCWMKEEQHHLISFAALSSVINQGKVMGSATGKKSWARCTHTHIHEHTHVSISAGSCHSLLCCKSLPSCWSIKIWKASHGIYIVNLFY